MALAPPDMLDIDDVDFGFDDVADLHERLRDLRATRPAAWVRCFGAATVMFTSHELVDAAFRDEATFPSAASYGRLPREVAGRTLQCMEGEEHRLNRALVSPAFRTRLMPDYVQPLLEPTVGELVEGFVADGEAELVGQFTRRLPFTVISRLLGLPPAAEEDIERWGLGLISANVNYPFAVRCAREFDAYLGPLVARRRDDPAHDLISTLATTELEGARLTDEEIFSFVRLLFPAGADTTYLGLGNTLYALLTHPDQMAILRADPAGESQGAAEEGLRWDAPVALLPRWNPDEVIWHGIPIPADTPLLFAIAAANRDPAVFPDPDRFDISRRPTNVLTFGMGVHFCLGAALARAEMEVALRMLIERLPNLRLADDDGVRIRAAVGVLRGPNRLPVRFG